MGLFDTVLSTDIAPGSYAMAIPAEFKYVAHAIALNEYREDVVHNNIPNSYGAFPLESIVGSANPHKHIRIERGFIGSHSDIGGGYEAGQTQLSRVALDWMLTQAENAGVKMEQDRDFKTIKANPILHDKSENQLMFDPLTDETYFPTTQRNKEDRDVRYMDGRTTKQMEMRGAVMTHADTEAFISYYKAQFKIVEVESESMGNYSTRVIDARKDHAVGTIDAKAYVAWLNRNGYNIKLKVE